MVDKIPDRKRKGFSNCILNSIWRYGRVCNYLWNYVTSSLIACLDALDNTIAFWCLVDWPKSISVVLRSLDGSLIWMVLIFAVDLLCGCFLKNSATAPTSNFVSSEQIWRLSGAPGTDFDTYSSVWIPRVIYLACASRVYKGCS